jgi:hypothetical protein
VNSGNKDYEMNAVFEMEFEVQPSHPLKSMQFKDWCTDLRGSQVQRKLTSGWYAMCKVHTETVNQPSCPGSINQRNEYV